MNEQQLGEAQWQNATNEMIHDPAKAEHMAHVEDAWREKAKDFGHMAVEAYDQQTAFNKPEDAVSSRDSFLKGHDRVMQEVGPKAVQEVADAYDALHDPHLPTQERNTLNITK